MSRMLGTTMALLIAMAAGQVLILAYGGSPLHVFRTLLDGTWGNGYGIGQVLFKATPLVFTGLAVALPFRAGLFNVGAEGQLVLGSLGAALVGMALPDSTPAVVALPLVAGTAFGVGSAWGAVPGLLKARRGTHEVITTILLNFVALALANYLVVTIWHVPETLHTEPIIAPARLSRLGSVLGPLRGSAVSTALPWALVAALAVWWLLLRASIGHEIRATGANPKAAEAAGISPGRVATLSMALAGGLAGLAGMSFVQGSKYYFEDGSSGGLGFMGIAVALLGRNHPVGVVLAALLFGTLSQGGLAINALVPKEIVEILQAVIILAVVAANREVRRVLRETTRGVEGRR